MTFIFSKSDMFRSNLDVRVWTLLLVYGSNVGM